MKFIREETYEAFGQRVATDVLQVLTKGKKPLLCPTAGNTPIAVYRALVQQIKNKGIDYSSWCFVGLDEWAGLDGSNAGSCRHFLNTELFEPLAIAESSICCFNGKAADLENECRRVETFILQQGGIDLALLGLGLNGHLGMNEPGTPATARAHVAQLSAQTQSVGQKYFSAAQNLSLGVTLGLATLISAKQLYLLATGAKKAAIVQQLAETAPTNDLPATHLKGHPNFTLYVDAEAAQLISDLM